MSKPDPEFIEPKLEPDELPRRSERPERAAAEHALPRLKVQPSPPPPPQPWPLVRFFVNLIIIHLIAAIVFLDALGVVWGIRWLMAH